MKLEEDRMCFACGEDNPISLGLKFSLLDQNTVKARFTPGDVHQGFDDIMHGGLVSTLLDEAMAKTLYLKGIKAYTAEIKVRYKKPVKIGQEVELTGILKKERGKLMFMEAYLKDLEGTIMARAEAKFIKVSEGVENSPNRL